jgi:hypothetical protein
LLPPPEQRGPKESLLLPAAAAAPDAALPFVVPDGIGGDMRFVGSV